MMQQIPPEPTNNMTITSSALLQREALRILSQMKSKPIIAVDLDYTVKISHYFHYHRIVYYQQLY